MNTLYHSSELRVFELRSLHRRDRQSKILGPNKRTGGHLEAAGSCYTCNLEGESRGTACRDRSGHVASCPSDSARVPSHVRIMH